MKKSILVAAGVLGSALMAATAANAAPLGGIATGGMPADDSIVQKIHDGNTHRACLLGPRGWHYHSRWRGRVACRPVSPGKVWIWRSEGGRAGWWHPRERRWNN